MRAWSGNELLAQPSFAALVEEEHSLESPAADVEQESLLMGHLPTGPRPLAQVSPEKAWLAPWLPASTWLLLASTNPRDDAFLSVSRPSRQPLCGEARPT